MSPVNDARFTVEAKWVDGNLQGLLLPPFDLDYIPYEKGQQTVSLDQGSNIREFTRNC